MTKIGERMSSSGVAAVVFVHGTFTGSDPLSAAALVERALPERVARGVARTIRKTTRAATSAVLGDLGNFGTAYVRLFEDAINGEAKRKRISCTEFVWSSENHHVGRLEAALALVRVLAAHAELAPSGSTLLLMGHSHAAQLFALVTQLLARSIATEAIVDVARVRGLDIGALERDLETLQGNGVDFVTFGAPARYAWADVEGVRVLHVLHAANEGALGDWIQKLGAEGSDFPAIDAEERRINTALGGTLGAGFSPTLLAKNLTQKDASARDGAFVFVDYTATAGALGSAIAHGVYTRLDAMLFNAHLIAERLYPDGTKRDAWSRVRALVDIRR